MSALHWGDAPTWFAAVATLAAVGGAFRIAHNGTEQNKIDRTRDRGYAIEDLVEERRRTDAAVAEERAIAQENLADERAIAASQRREDHMTRLLLEVYDLYAAYRQADGPGRNELLFQLHPRLAVVPAELAVTVRIGIHDTTSTMANRNKAAWLRHRLGQDAELTAETITWEAVAREAEFDLWWARKQDAPPLDRLQYPWHDFDTLRNSEN